MPEPGQDQNQAVAVPAGATFGAAQGGAVTVPEGATFGEAISGQQQAEQPKQPGFGQRTYEASGLKGLIDTAKQKWQESQAAAQEEQKMAESAVEALKSKNYGQAAELILGHLAKHVGLGPGTGTMLDVAGGLKGSFDSSVQSTAKHIVKGVQAAKGGNYGTAALEGAGALGGDERMIEDIENKNVAGLAGDVTGGGIQAAAMLLPGAKGLGGEAAAGEEAAAAAKPGWIKQAIKGEKVAQEPVKAAIRSTSGAEEGTPIIEGNKTAIDQRLQDISKQEREAYQRQDKAAGFDVKETRKKLSDAEYKVKQPEIDDATRERLTKTIEESKNSLADAEARMREATVDPKEADSLFKQRKAGEDFRKTIVQHTSSDGETVNVEGLLNATKKLRFAQKGDRLAQFLGGTEKADEFMHKLEAAQDLGEKAIAKQKLAKWVGGAIGLGAVEETARHLMP